MKKHRSLLLIIIISLASMTGTQAGDAHKSAIKRIAKIALSTNHFPSDSDKAELKTIMNNKNINDSLRIIAHALHNIQHSVNNTDKKALNKIANDAAAQPDIRKLAKILSDFNHNLSSNVSKELENIIGA